MDRTLESPIIAASRSGAATAFFRRLLGADGKASAREVLDRMPRERLEDMGIAPRTEANLRSGGERGPIPQAQLW